MMKTILVIDDEPLICQLLAYQLGEAGYTVVTEQDGALALARLPLVRPDLILLDVMMPSVSGWDLCRQIRACSTVPVIMLTAKCDEMDVVTGLNHGADDYIAKPFRMPQLLARIEAALRRAGMAHGQTARRETRDSQPDPHLHYPVEVFTERPAPPLHMVAMPAAGAPELVAAPAPRLGDSFAAERRRRGLSLQQVEQACGVRWEFLQALEHEQFTFVPRPQLRHALLVYGAFLGIDPRQFVGRPAPSRPAAPRAPIALVATLVLLLAMVLSIYLF